MKGKLFLFGLCVLALASCSIDEVSRTNDSNAISFKATTTTRATVVTTNNIDAFSVWGWKTDADGSVTETMIDGDTATKGSTGTYNTERTYYWPGCAMDFCAFIPVATEIKDGAVQLGSDTAFTNDILEDGSAYDYTGYVATATVTSPDEMSVKMHVPAEPEEEIDLCYAVTKGRSTGSVPLNFRHALSQIAFKAMNGNADWTVDIQEVTLCGIYKEGTYTLPVFEVGEEGTTGQNSDTAKKGTWTVDENAPKGRFNAGIDATTLKGLTAEAKNITGSSLMLVPQTVPEWDALTDPTNKAAGAYVRIKCQVIDEEEGQIWPNYKKTDESTGEPLEYAEITVPFDVKWDEGYKYTYTIVFGEGLGYYPPDDGDPDLEGMPVLISIRFTVDIDDFDKTDGTDVSTEPEPVPIDYFDYIIDANFLAYMQKFDINKDGHLYYDELEYITEINCAAEDFTGIEYYYNLESFTAVNAKCTSKTFEVDNLEGVLDLSNNTKLSYVYMKGAPVETVILSDTSLKNLWDEAFRGCTKLTTVMLPDCLERIGINAFRESTLASIDLSKANLKTIDEAAFRDCSSLYDVKLPEEIDTVNSSAFYGCTSLKSIEFPIINNIGAYVFHSCGLESVEIPCGMETTGFGTFWSCTALKDVTLPSTLKIVEDDAFYECSALETIVIPEGVTAIGSTLSATGSSFGQCTKLSSVTLPKTLEFIGCSAFDNCDSLESIEIPDSVTEIGDRAFENSDALASINLPDNLTYLGEYAFDYCKKLTSMSIPAISKINEGTFRGCSGLKTVTISDEVISIGDYAFYMCYSLSSANLPTSLTEIGDYAFSGDYPLTSVGTVPEGVTTIGKQAFYTLYLSEIDLPSTLTYIGDEAYSVCFLLTKATVRAETPPNLGGNNVFYSIGNNAVLYVPSTSVSAYENAGWGSYFKGGIYPIDGN